MDPKKLNQFRNDEQVFLKILNQSIKDYILFIDKHEIIEEETIAKMSESLTVFAAKATHKFILGQQKHGGKITDKDLDKEINQEVLDLFWYLEAKDWQLELYEDECRKETESKEESTSDS